MRRVLNGAAKFHGHSLNKSLLTGRDLLQRLLYTIIRFRQHKIAVSADIEGMFLQVGVLEQEQPSLPFLWREDPTKNVEVYQYTRHIFGAKDSPTCANYALQRTAKDNRAAYPDAAQAVHEKFYMDDYLDSMETREEALNRCQDLVRSLCLGGFNLPKFISNDFGLLRQLSNQSEPNGTKALGTSEAESSSYIRGLKWDHQHDTLVVSRGIRFDVPTKVTQRIVLSSVAKVFDPLALVVPFTVGAPLFLEEIWRSQGQQWDDVLLQAPLDKFLKWTADLPIIGAPIVPRAYFTDRSEALELHVFGDGSQEVLSSVAFLRGKVRNSKAAQVAFVIGKARVAPMKVMTVPKLEVQAAVLASRLASVLKKPCRSLFLELSCGPTAQPCYIGCGPRISSQSSWPTGSVRYLTEAVSTHGSM